MTAKSRSQAGNKQLPWRMAAIIFVVLILLDLSSGCGRFLLKRYELYVTGPFDTVTTALIVADSQENFDHYRDIIESELWRYHHLYNIYNDSPDGTNLKTVNDRAGGPVDCSAELCDLVVYGVDVYDRTAGRVNIAMGSVLKLWHDARMTANLSPDEAHLPEQEVLAKAAAHISIRDVIVDCEAGTVELSDPAMSLDVGAIAKGFAVERIAVKLEAEGLCSGVLDVGGNVRSIGLNQVTGKPWRIGIRNPDNSPAVELLDKVNVTGQSVVTSGNYERSFKFNGILHSHIIDPDTLCPANFHDAVTVIAPDSATADSLSTALMLMSVDDGNELLKAFQGCEAMWVTDGDCQVSSGFRVHRTKSQG